MVSDVRIQRPRQTRKSKIKKDASRTRKYSPHVRFPDTLESDEDDEEPSPDITFEDFKRKCGITEKLTLNKMLEIKDPQTRVSQAELFWAKITSLDYRITSSDLTIDNTVNVRDLIFAIFHSSENLLRQDIAYKMSSCQLAVPLVVNGAESNKPLFFYGAFRTIRKKLQTSTDSDPIERPIFQHAIFTVSFLRIGDVSLSKSNLLNTLLSECQGTQTHSFFTSRLNDSAKPIFYNGSIEVVWYTPQEGDKRLLKEAAAFLNLRGDSNKFPHQIKFAYKVSNLIVVLIGKQNWQTYKQTVENIKVKANEVLFLAINESNDDKAKASFDFKHEGVIVVRKLEMKHLSEVLCRKIDQIQESLSDSDLLALEAYKDLVKDIVQLDVSLDHLDKIKSIIDKIVCSERDVKFFKKKILSLHPMWLKWTELDNASLIADSSEEYSREEQLASRKEAQLDERKKQINTGLSEEVKHFWELLNLIDLKNDMFDDCLIYLQAVLFDLTYKYQGSLESSKKFIYERMQHKSGDTKEKMAPQVDLLKIYSTESRDEWNMRIGIEDFIRELGQLFEAHIQCNEDRELPSHIMRLPFLAAQFLVKGNTLEILDDRSYCIPSIWISSIIDELSRLLGETAKIMVLSVIGVQGSGKSTLLNTMFGTKFPISAGRCTKGVFIRLLKVGESFAIETGCSYIIVIDTEGLNADHGGLVLDKTSNRRLDNKMTTLAMCLADLIIVNIEGELISSDTTNFLEIAAYAFIRMKEVDLKAQCRIIQQRVCDITAPVKNRNNMRKIIYDLDRAVQDVAKSEGFVDSYQSFSEIFKLNVEDHTQYVPNLWSGNMNPPNPLYGEVVTKFKRQILDSIQKKDLEIQFTFETFGNRLLAVDTALNEENFALNFEDVSRAIAYNDFSLQCNKWLGEVRVKVTDTWITWQRKVKTTPSSEREHKYRNFKGEIANEIDRQRENVRDKFKLYLQNNHDEKYSYKNYFNTWIEASLSEFENEIQIKISNEVKAIQQKPTDVPSFVAEMAKEVRLKATQRATSIRESDSERCNAQHLQKYFNEFWDESRNAILKKYQLQKVSEEDIRKACSRILQKLCTGNAIEKDVLRLLDNEGDISNHRKDFDCAMYSPTKNITEKVWNAVQQLGKKKEKAAKNINVFVEEVKKSILGKFETDCKGEAFDPYLVQTTLQKALANLTLTGNAGNIKLPYMLIAKVLLHLCANISDLSTINNNKHQKENPCQELFDKQESEIYLDYKAFYNDRYQNARAFQYVCRLISQQFTRCTLDSLRSRIITYFNNNVIQTKRNMHDMVLKYLYEENEPLLYIDFINSYAEFLINWLKERMINTLSTKKNNVSWIQSEYEEMLSNIPPLPVSLVQELSKASSMQEWCEKFTKSSSEQQNMQFDLHEAVVYQVSNIAELSTNIINFYQEILNGRMRTNPLPGNSGQYDFFLEITLDRPFEDVIRTFLGCQDQCPFCKAPCSEENLSYHKHTAFCHYPRGLSGKKWETNKLVEEFCTSSVASNEVHYEKDGEFFLYKDYKKHFPSWKIPTYANKRLMHYWKWVFHKLNDYCSNYFLADSTEIPKFWASEYMLLRAKSAINSLSFNEQFRLSFINRLYSD